MSNKMKTRARKQEARASTAEGEHINVTWETDWLLTDG